MIADIHEDRLRSGRSPRANAAMIADIHEDRLRSGRSPRANAVMVTDITKIGFGVVDPPGRTRP
jgi:hypothetical protein